MSEPRESVDLSDLKETFLECNVCFDTFDQTDKRPRLLHSCLHAFCSVCLERLLVKEGGRKQITCPLCRRVQRVRGGVHTLPIDPVRNKLVDYVQLKNKKTTLCSDCEKGNAVSRCQECQCYLCKECDYIHKNHRLTKGHVIVSLEEVLQQPIKNLSAGHMCPKHPKHHLEYYCTTDEELCCVSCTVLDHKGHDLIGLDKADEERREEVEVLLKDAQIKVDEMRTEKQRLAKRQKHVVDTKSKSMNDIATMFAALRKELDQRERFLIAALDEKSAQMMSTIQKTANALDQTIAVIESTEIYYTEANQKADVVEMLKLYPTFKRSLAGLEPAQSENINDGDVQSVVFEKQGNEDVEKVVKGLGGFRKVQPGASSAGVPVIGRRDIVSNVQEEGAGAAPYKCGNMPPGKMSVTEEREMFVGYVYSITYDIKSGHQTAEHPNPGKPHTGGCWTVVLRKDKGGERVLRLLKVAFQRRLTFTVVTSPGAQDQVTWNGITHNTRWRYCDDAFVQRVTAQLAAKGLTEADIDWSVPVKQSVVVT